MTKSNPRELYTRPRFHGPADHHIGAFADALRWLLRRMDVDLRRSGDARFGGRRLPVMLALAGTIPAMIDHVDAFEATARAGSDDPEAAETIRTIVANVAADHDLAGRVTAMREVPTAKEGKFDQGLGGTLIEESGNIADKLADIGTAFPPIAPVLGLLSAIVRDIGIFGRTVFGLSGGDEVGEQLENKLELVIDQGGRIEGGIGGLTAGGGRIERIVQDIDRETKKIEIKADTLGDLLGRTLVGKEWIVDPDRTRDGPNRVPARDVKQELHDIEDLLRLLIRLVTGWTPPPPPPVTDGPPPPPEQPPPEDPPPPPETPEVPPLFDVRLKKIFVYDEGTVRPQTTDEKVIVVQSGAFDLFGWLDLTALRPGDIVEARTSVSIAGRAPVLYDTRRFFQPGLYTLADFARGESYLSGNRIEVGLRQVASADAFATTIELAYQLVVESQ